MPLFEMSNQRLKPISETKIDLEHDIQKLTEQNLEIIFGLKFVSGISNHEFCVRSSDQDFFIDTLAFDEENKSIVLIEYKKDRSFSIIDQGFAYLAAMLNSKADFVLEINEKLEKNFAKKNIDWEQSRIIFISNEFTNYQKNAINFRDLPMFLYEVKIYNNNLIDYNPIKPLGISESINKYIKSKTVRSVAKEIKVFTLEDHLKNKPDKILGLFQKFQSKILEFDDSVSEVVKKFYIGYKNNSRFYFATFHIYINKLQIDLLVEDSHIKDSKKILQKYPDSYGYAKNLKHFDFKIGDDFDYVFDLIKQSYEFNKNR